MDMTLWDAEQQQQGGSAHGLGLSRPPWLPSPYLGGKPIHVDCCGSQQEECCCLRGITIPLLNWELNKLQAGLKAVGVLGTSEIEMNCGQPQGVNFAAPMGASFFPFFIDIAGNSNIQDPWILQYLLYGQRSSKEHRQGAKRKSWQWQG